MNTNDLLRQYQATHIPAYFKSTDGHFNNWSFNLRRANIHLLDLIADSHAYNPLLNYFSRIFTQML
jgi:hypothetical protein